MTWIWGVQATWDWISKLAKQIADEIHDLIILLLGQIRAFGDLAIARLLDALQGMFPTVDWSGARSVLDSINFFFPLSETISYVTILLSLWLLVWLYRLIKSWIPTVAS
jgi:hypothetical protein